MKNEVFTPKVDVEGKAVVDKIVISVSGKEYAWTLQEARNLKIALESVLGNAWVTPYIPTTPYIWPMPQDWTYDKYLCGGTMSTGTDLGLTRTTGSVFHGHVGEAAKT